MSAEEEAIAGLRDSGLGAVLVWAAPAAFAATDRLYDEDAGHDQGVIGYLNYKHLVDLIDRATSNGRFRLGEGVDGHGDDVVIRGITAAVFRAMPAILPSAIVRKNYRQSPGWAAGGYRVLLQSFLFGHVDEIRWEERSDAKRRVAGQPFLADDMVFDFADVGMESLVGIPDDDGFSGVTLVAAHAFNPTTKEYELYVGQSKNPAHADDSCWYWRRRLISGGTLGGGVGLSVTPTLPGDAASTQVDDVVVRMKESRSDDGSRSSNG